MQSSPLKTYFHIDKLPLSTPSINTSAKYCASEILVLHTSCACILDTVLSASREREKKRKKSVISVWVFQELALETGETGRVLKIPFPPAEPLTTPWLLLAVPSTHSLPVSKTRAGEMSLGDELVPNPKLPWQQGLLIASGSPSCHIFINWKRLTSHPFFPNCAFSYYPTMPLSA